MKKPSEQEIQHAITLLNQLKGKIPRYSKFNDDNHKMIDLEILVLQGKLFQHDIEDMNEYGSSLLDCLEWKRGERQDWFEDRISDLANFM